MNNVNLEKILETREKIVKGEIPAYRLFEAEGEWMFGETQFRANLTFENGSITLFTDQPTPSGGKGNAPNPVQYCVFSMIACYATTFVTIATMRGVKIDSLKVRGYSKVNMKSVFEIEEGPVVEEVGITLEVVSPAPMEVLEEIKKLADQKCPAAYTVSHAVPFRSEIKALQP
jgi:uncharacterized OsmC-like protein